MGSQPRNKGIYTAFAQVYDHVMRDIQYSAWADHLERLWKHHGFAPSKALNLACGTGCLELELVKRGLKVIGLDQSAPMLEIARRRCGKCKPPVEFVCAGMESFNLGQSVDLALCLYDSINYLTVPKDVQRTFKQVFQHLQPGGGFIFDITTEYNILNSYNGYTYAEDWGEGAYIWDNTYKLADRMCWSRFIFFMPEAGQAGRNKQGCKYQRWVEDHYQRVYATWEIEEMLHTAGFEVLGTYHGMTLEPLREDTERIHFVALKPE